ncbi:hypothetical protein BT69DRAFT_1296737 [Atractiella rhizophila]|nr:hypothetical protein BT69DRAFT_1296737 [Atractiella rhizophila]
MISTVWYESGYETPSIKCYAPIKPACTRDVPWDPAPTYKCSSPPAAVNPIDPAQLWSWTGGKEHSSRPMESTLVRTSSFRTVDAEWLLRDKETRTPHLFQLGKPVIPKERQPFCEWSFQFEVPRHTNCECPRPQVPVPPTRQDAKFKINYSIQLIWRRNERRGEISLTFIIGNECWARWFLELCAVRPLTLANQIVPLAKVGSSPGMAVCLWMHLVTPKASPTTIFLNYHFLIHLYGTPYVANGKLNSLMERLQISSSQRLVLRRTGTATVLPITKVGVGISGIDLCSTWKMEGHIEITEENHLVWDSCNAKMQLVLPAALSYLALSSDVTIESPIDDFGAIVVDVDQGVFTELPYDGSFTVAFTTSETKAPSSLIPESLHFPIQHFSLTTQARHSNAAFSSCPTDIALIELKKDAHSLYVQRTKSFMSYQTEDTGPDTCFEFSHDLLARMHHELHRGASSAPNFVSFKPTSSDAEAENQFLETSFMDLIDALLASEEGGQAVASAEFFVAKSLPTYAVAILALPFRSPDRSPSGSNIASVIAAFALRGWNLTDHFCGLCVEESKFARYLFAIQVMTDIIRSSGTDVGRTEKSLIVIFARAATPASG